MSVILRNQFGLGCYMTQLLSEQRLWELLRETLFTVHALSSRIHTEINPSIMLIRVQMQKSLSNTIYYGYSIIVQ